MKANHPIGLFVTFKDRSPPYPKEGFSAKGTESPGELQTEGNGIMVILAYHVKLDT